MSGSPGRHSQAGQWSRVIGSAVGWESNWPFRFEIFVSVDNSSPNLHNVSFEWSPPFVGPGRCLTTRIIIGQWVARRPESDTAQSQRSHGKILCLRGFLLWSSFSVREARKDADTPLRSCDLWYLRMPYKPTVLIITHSTRRKQV